MIQTIASLLQCLEGRFLLAGFIAFATGTATAEPYAIELSARNSIQLNVHGMPPLQRQSTARLEERLSGSEDSECRPYGRKSTSTATAEVLEVERKADGISFSLIADSAAFGGHYRNCGACVLQNCIGIMGNDTGASSAAGSNATVMIKFDREAIGSNYLIDVGAASHGVPPSISLTDKAGRPAGQRTLDGSYEVKVDAGSIYYVTASVNAATANSGECCNDKGSSSTRVDIRLRKAPILASRKDYEPFIKGGAETSSYTNVGAILIDGRLHCTGTVIGPRTVLTAAHCLHGYENQFEKFAFLVGSNLLQPSFGPVKVTELAYPNGDADGFRFNPTTLEDDIGVIYLAEPTKITPAKLHTGLPPWSDIAERISLIFVGYGFDVVEDQKVGAGIKREAAWKIDGVENRRVRFSVPGKNTCKGDSGGPAFIIFRGVMSQVAVTSGGTPDCSSGFETRVDAFLGWLQGRIR